MKITKDVTNWKVPAKDPEPLSGWLIVLGVVFIMLVIIMTFPEQIAAFLQFMAGL